MTSHACSSRRASRIVLSLALAAAAVGLVACGDDEESGGEAKAVSVELTGADPSKLSLSAPESTDGGLVRVDFKNATKLPADAQLVRVDGDHSVEEVLEVTSGDEEGRPIPDWLHGAGGVGTTPPGASGTGTQVLEEGTHYVIADVQTGEDGPEAKPATATLEVEGGGDGELPEADATITAEDYGFATDGLKPGKNTVKFENVGNELHHAIAFPYAPGATLEQVKKAFAEEEPPKGPPPVQFEKSSGTVVLDGGAEQVTELNLQAGKNVLVCFISDRKGGPPHIAKGMISEVEVK